MPICDYEVSDRLIFFHRISRKWVVGAGVFKMKRIFICISSLVIVIVFLLGVVFYFNFDVVPSDTPSAASTISVETKDGAMASAITEDVGGMLLQHQNYFQRMRQQGAASSKEYEFWLRGTCAQAADLVAAVTEVIRRYTDAPVRCIDPT